MTIFKIKLGHIFISFTWTLKLSFRLEYIWWVTNSRVNNFYMIDNCTLTLIFENLAPCSFSLLVRTRTTNFMSVRSVSDQSFWKWFNEVLVLTFHSVLPMENCIQTVHRLEWIPSRPEWIHSRHVTKNWVWNSKFWSNFFFYLPPKSSYGKFVIHGMT